MKNVFLSNYLLIAILCAKMSRVTILCAKTSSAAVPNLVYAYPNGYVSKKKGWELLI